MFLVACLRCLVIRAGLLAANTSGAGSVSGVGHARAVTTDTTLGTSGKAFLASLDQSKSGTSSSVRRSVTSNEDARPFFREMVREEATEGLQDAAAARTACSSATALEPYPQPPQYDTSRCHEGEAAMLVFVKGGGWNELWRQVLLAKKNQSASLSVSLGHCGRFLITTR
jgi:hypothetical protein